MKNTWADLKSNFSDSPEDSLFIIGSDIPFYNIPEMELQDIRAVLMDILHHIEQRLEKK